VKASTAKSPVPWFGGKQKLCERICELFPAHDSYVEVFGGGGSVLFTKMPATLEIYNDKDQGLVTFFRLLRDRPEELVALLELTPYSRAEWQLCRETWRNEDLDELERARRWFVVATQSFGGMVARGREGWGSGVRIWGAAGGPAGWKADRVAGADPPPDQTEPAENGAGPNGERHHGRGWGGERLGRMHLSRAASNSNRIDNIWRFVERLRLVQIENLEWNKCIPRYDHETALFYLDPPYVPRTRRAGGYDHELSIEDHEKLVVMILGLRGTAIVSGYDDPIYHRLVTDGGYSRYEYGVWSTAGQRKSGNPRDRRREMIWASPRAAAPTLFDHIDLGSTM
jgi:DNA adenine methylase